MFFGGDQLTEERARNLQKARANGRDILERLEIFWAKFEDWHGLRTGTEVHVSFL